MDLDGDGALSMFELEYFYEEQCRRLDCMAIEALPFEDCLCQMLDLVKPQTEGDAAGGTGGGAPWGGPRPNGPALCVLPRASRPAGRGTVPLKTGPRATLVMPVLWWPSQRLPTAWGVSFLSLSAPRGWVLSCASPRCGRCPASPGN